MLGYPDSAAVGLAVERRELDGVLQLPLVRDQVGAPAVAGGEADQFFIAAEPQRASGVGGRSVGDGFGQRRRGTPGLRPRLWNPEDRAAGRRAAGCSAF